MATAGGTGRAVAVGSASPEPAREARTIHQPGRWRVRHTHRLPRNPGRTTGVREPQAAISAGACKSRSKGAARGDREVAQGTTAAANTITTAVPPTTPTPPEPSCRIRERRGLRLDPSFSIIDSNSRPGSQSHSPSRDACRCPPHTHCCCRRCATHLRRRRRSAAPR